MVRVNRELPSVIDGAFRYSDPWFRVYIESIFGERLGMLPGAVAEVEEELFARFEDPRTFRLYPGAVELFEELRRLQLGVGIVSNWSPRLEKILAGLELEGFLDFVLCSSIEGVEKPDSAIFARALERAGVSAGEALHVGDHPVKDVQGALQAGIDAVLIDHRGRHEEPAEARWTRVGGLDELRSYILRRCS
jgi:putative hydrolase of the HAD superfamily